jgi:Transcriptional regulator, AbiEi antitoxin
MPPQNRTDQIIARLAWRNHGVVTRRRLLAAGVTHDQIKTRIARGSLIVVYPGVYRVGHRAPSVEADYMAAVLACGEGAQLMGAAAAHLYRLIKGQPPGPVVRTRTERRIRGIETHRAHRRGQRGTEWKGIPITTVPQTLIDLTPSMPTDQLARAAHEAQVRFGIRPDPTMPPKLRAILEGDIPVTLSELEARFLTLLAENGLPRPKTNRIASKRRVDCRWPTHRLTVELDSYTFHNTRHAWEQDRKREREAHARGDQHRRYTYGDVFEDPHQMLAELHALLA